MNNTGSVTIDGTNTITTLNSKTETSTLTLTSGSLTSNNFLNEGTVNASGTVSVTELFNNTGKVEITGTSTIGELITADTFKSNSTTEGNTTSITKMTNSGYAKLDGNNTVATLITSNVLDISGTSEITTKLTNTGTVNVEGTTTFKDIENTGVINLNNTNTIKGNVTENGSMNVLNGTTTLTAGGHVYTEQGLSISENAIVDVASSGRLDIGSNNDIWKGTVKLTDATSIMNYAGLKSGEANNVLLADLGKLTTTGGEMTITGGSVDFNSPDSWTGKITLSNGTLNYVDLTSNGVFVAENGELNILKSEITNTTLNINDNSSIAEDVVLTLAENKYNIEYQ